MATDASNDELEAIATEVRAVVENLVTEDDVPWTMSFLRNNNGYSPNPFQFVAGSGAGTAVRGDGERGPVLRPPPPALGAGCLAKPGCQDARRYPPEAQPFLLRVGVWRQGAGIVIEIVSNREGGEDTKKLATYAEIGIRYYVIYDPDRMLGAEALRVYRLEGMSFHRLDDPIWFPRSGSWAGPLAGSLRGHGRHVAAVGRCHGRGGAHGTRASVPKKAPRT